MTRLLLLIVYASFFWVQSFYTPGNNYSSAAALLSAQKHISEKNSSETFSDKKAQDREPSFKLNKRFHPEAVHAVAHLALRPDEIVVAVKHFNKPKDYFLVSSILADSLRGPPVSG